ncbi:MAG: endopeptidase La [candidate division WOR-3 bacterium]
MEEKEFEFHIPEVLPVIPVKGGVIFPGIAIPFTIKEETYQRLIDEALKQDKIFGSFLQKEEKKEFEPENIFKIGTAVYIHRMFRAPDGSMRLFIQGIKRVEILEFLKKEIGFYAKVKILQDELPKDNKILEALKHSILSTLKEIIQAVPYIPEEALIFLSGIEDYSIFTDMVASSINIEPLEKQRLLETLNLEERMKKVLSFLTAEKEVASLSKKIKEEVDESIERTRREHILREQLRAIQKELGELDETEKEIQELRKKIEEKKMPDEAREVALRELDKLSRMHPASPEYSVSRNYIDWLIALPWSEETEDILDLERAKKILDEDHYNLEKVKERILEFLAVRIIKKGKLKGPILCFIGPPGVGKTSLGKSIARALGRKFIRMALGGIRDEAEIRGHRRTYVGALPGRIIQGIRQVGTKNPVFMLDEVDKIGLDFRGDPASALLEVLDPEQNYSFRDHYIEVPFDLSQVFFIATANTLYTIPPPLLDRMEIIEIPGYVDKEKLFIATRYLIPRQKKENGLDGMSISFTRKALEKIINEYTREAGVRQLERKIGEIMRKIAMEILRTKDGKTNFVITPSNVEKYLGSPIFYSETKIRKGTVGVATGLAWTPTGGEILFIESAKMPGRGALILTGKLGEVMRESCQAALTLIRANSKACNINYSEIEKSDIHIHVPEGAIPKDGPSAGVAIFVSLLSLFTGKPVDPEVAMTGEITLRGKVMPVGGIKEKVLAAKRAGIKKVILPSWNEKDVRELPSYITKGMEFIYVDNIYDVIKYLFPDLIKEKKVKKRK